MGKYPGRLNANYFVLHYPIPRQLGYQTTAGDR